MDSVMDTVTKNEDLKIKICLLICEYFVAAVRNNKNAQNCTDLEIINVIKAWLVRSKDRFNNDKNKERVDEETLNNAENPDV